MKTLTIADAKKNLSRLLQAAAKGEDIGIASGDDVIALRKVEGGSDDYAWKEYGVTQEEVKAFSEASEARYRLLKRSGQLVRVTSAKHLRNLIEKGAKH